LLDETPDAAGPGHLTGAAGAWLADTPIDGEPMLEIPERAVGLTVIA